MIDYTYVRRTIESYLNDNFTECVIQFENVPLSHDNPSELIALSDSNVDSVQAAMGDQGQICTGLLVVSIYTTLNTGTERSREIADVLSGLLAQQNIEGIAFRDTELKSIPAHPDDVYFLQQLYVSYIWGYGSQIDSC